MAESNKQGWIKLHRSIQDNWVWKDKPFSKGQAWIDLLLMANHKDVKRLHNGKIQIFKRGTVCRSKSNLAERWGWDRRTVSRFLDGLQLEKMLYVDSTRGSTTKGTVITIEKWGFYQDDSTADGTADSTMECTSRAHHAPINKNDKNDKKNISCASDDAQGGISENKEPASDKPTKKQKTQTEADEFFETLWEMYPRKKGKGSVKPAQRRKLYAIGIEEMTRAVERYRQYIAGKDEQYIQYGSTFFNSGYVDYLDKNYQPETKQSKTSSSGMPANIDRL